jgi:Na+/proline symporter
MWAVATTDFIQTIIIVIGMLIIATIMIGQVGGASAVLDKTPTGFFSLMPKPGLKNGLDYLMAWITIGLGSVPQQDVFQRIMSAKSEKTAIHGAYFSGLMYLTVAMLPLAIALCGKILYPELLKGSEVEKQMLLPKMVLQHSGLGLQILFFGALISAILSTASGAILAPATIIGENIFKSYQKNVSDTELLRVMRWAVIGVTAVSILFALGNDSIYDLVSQSSAISLVSLFVPLMFGLYWKPASAWGALAAMLGGSLVWLIATIMDSEYPPVLFGLTASILGMIGGSVLQKRRVTT